MVGSIVGTVLEIYLSFQQWKNFENTLRIDKVIAMSMVYYFFGDTVYNTTESMQTACLTRSNSQRYVSYMLSVTAIIKINT